MRSVEVLLVSQSLDIATDYVVACLRAAGASYYRLDLDLAAEDRVTLDPVRGSIELCRGTDEVRIAAPSLRSILFRAPTHLRESSGHRYAPEDLLKRHQWAAFARSLMALEGKWVNHPASTYSAENKPYQLRRAHLTGFKVPETRIANFLPNHLKGGEAIIKALDTFLVRGPDGDRFFYTTLLEPDDAVQLGGMPSILQPYLRKKLDLRVTVVGKYLHCVEIVAEGAGIEGDWRLLKDRAEFRPHSLPTEIANLCLKLIRDLGLYFAAIDLVKVRDEYYFLEVNPTGEWAWLVDATGERIDRRLAQALLDPDGG